MKRISIEDLKKEQVASKMYQEAKKMLHESWELAIAKVDAKYNKEVEAKFQKAEAKLAEADALIPNSSEYKKWTVVEKLLASSVAEDDPNYDLKRFEIKKWFEYHTCFLNKQIQNPSGYMVETIHNILSDSSCWNGSALDRTAVAKKLIMSKGFDGREQDGFELYHIACQFCLEDEINNMFEESKREGYPIEEYIHSATRPSKLTIFWYYYANAINVVNPDLELVNKFKKLVGDIDDKQVLYRYGIDCAVERGSKEAVEFFWNKLPNKDPKTLIEIAIKTKSSSYAPSHSNITAFCIDQLDAYEQPDLFRELIRKDLIKNSNYHGSSSHVINSLRAGHFYEYIEKVIKHLKPSDLPKQEYEKLTWNTCESIVSGSGAVFDQAVHFLTWLWDLPGFQSHQQHFHDTIETTSSILGKMINIGVLEPVHRILGPMDTLHSKLFTLTCQEGDNVCYSLYTQNEGKLLQKLLNSIKTTVKKPTKKFVEKLDQDVLKKLENVLCVGKKPTSHKGGGDSCSNDDVSTHLQVFNFYKQYDRQSLEKLLCDILGNAKGGKLLHKIDQVMSNKLSNMITNTKKSYHESLFYNSSDSDHHDNLQDDSGSLDSSVLVIGEGHTLENANS
ncbi:hypothetical protein [Candidatus Tisiphia endosymbiont of Nemotelus uliginosus]|uniref:hypothetical protein n=1 Tax=Candidatus Tisiphia endosymbiont of Nemotelus uliginosus TaxID=3077926 RepID=UPI0035C90FE6